MDEKYPVNGLNIKSKYIVREYVLANLIWDISVVIDWHSCFNVPTKCISNFEKKNS